MSGTWGWRPERMQGIWRHGPLWFRPVSALSPWVAVALCVMTLYVVGNSQTMARGVLFDLPDAALDDGEVTSLVATVMPTRDGTTVFFDDARYSIGDGISAAAFGECLAERIGTAPQKTVLMLADRRIPCGDLMRLVAIARASGAERVLFANERSEERAE